MEIVAGLLRHPSPISIDGGEACETFPYVFEHSLCRHGWAVGRLHRDHRCQLAGKQQMFAYQ